jgi:D-alanine--poly(phosphoribitol) ligase subunit 2
VTPTTLEQVRALFADVVGVEPSDDDMDLIAAGLIDSLALVELLFALEQRIGIEIPLEVLDIERFRTIKRLAALVDECREHDASDAA